MGQSYYSICASIQILNPKSSGPLDNGVLLLDTDSSFEIRVTRRLEELVDLNKISIDQVLDFDIPASNKNKLELGPSINPNAADFDFKPIPVQVFVGGNVLTFTLLHVRSYSESTKRYACQLLNDDTHWINGSKNLKCRDITDWPLFTFTVPNVLDNFENQAKYLDGEIGMYLPLCFYGAWYETGNVRIHDLRPLIHDLALLQRGFAHIGYIFRCPYLETDFGRRLGSYLIDPLLETDSFDIRKNSVSARTTSTQTGDFFGKIILGHEDYDDSNSYDNTTGDFSANGIFHVTAELVIDYRGAVDGNPDNIFPSIEIQLVRKNGQGVEEILNNYSGTAFNDEGGVHYHLVEFEGLPISDTDKIYIKLNIRNNSFGEWNVYFKSTPANKLQFREGSVLNPPSIISKTLTLYNFLQGTVHKINGKLDTDISNRTLTLYTAFDTDVFGENIEGYYKENIINDLIPNQVCESTEVESVDIKNKRFLRLQFKDSNDARIIGLNFPKDNPPFSKTYDIGKPLNEEIEISANPLYEPTICDEVKSILVPFLNQDPATIESLKVGLPFLVDNGDKKLSFNIGYRNLYFAGFVGLTTPEGNTLRWKFEGQNLTEFPYAFQFATSRKADNSPFDRWLVYGDRENEHFDKYWKRDVIESQYNFSNNILYHAKPYEFFNFSFREYYKFLFEDQQVIARLVEARDFDGCSNLATPFKLIPQSNRPETFLPDPTANNNNCSSQVAKLVINKSGDDYTFSANNSAISKTIESQTIRWKYVGSNTWTVGTSVSSPTGKFIVQLQTKVEGCSDSFDSKLVDPCGNNVLAILWTYRYDTDLSQHCLTATVGGLINDAIISTIGEKTIYSGVSSVTSAYTEGTDICTNGTKVSVQFTVQLDNTCDPIVIESVYDLTNIITSCLNNKPVSECTLIAIGAFGLRLGGSWTSKMQIHFFQTRPIGADDNSWIKWDEHEPLFPGTFEARVVVLWCDHCPPVCSEPIVCMEPMPGMINAMSIFETDEYNWDFDKLPEYEYENVKRAFNKKEFGKLMVIHNQYKLSPYKYCCGENDRVGIEAWFKIGIENDFKNA